MRKIGKSRYWGCSNRITNGRAVCDSHHVNEDVLYATYNAALDYLLQDSETVLERLQEETAAVMNCDSKAALDAIDQKIINVQERVLELHKEKKRQAISEACYDTKLKEYSKQLEVLDAEQQRLQSADARYATARAWLQDFKNHVLNTENTGARDGRMIKALVEAIIVWEDRMEIRFKCGVSVEQKYVK